MRSVHILENFPSARNTVRKRSRLNPSRVHAKAEDSPKRPASAVADLFSKRALIVVESEGAVFDTLAHRHERAYLPAFVGCFSWGLDPLLCGHLWRTLALSSRLRGQDPLVILLSALRLLNRYSPSIRRAAVIKVLDSYLALQVRNPMQLAASNTGSPERLILDWISMSEALLRDEGYAPDFSEAHGFLKLARHIAPGAEVLAYSTLPEAVALNQWEVAGLGDCFLRIAGSERGDFSEYVRAALKNGYDRVPILVVGTSSMALMAAQTVGARFFPIIPFKEEESWSFLAEQFFPAFMRGEASLLDRDSRDFTRMMLEDLNIAAILASFEGVHTA